MQNLIKKTARMNDKPLPQFLSSKVAFSVTRKTKLPFQKREFPRLSNMCLYALSQHFGNFPTLDGMERHFKEQVFDNMTTNFEMHKLAKHVDYDPFWKKACFERWKMQSLPSEHVSWQAAFFSRYLQEKIEDLEDLDRDYADLVELLKVMAHSTFRLRIDQVKADFDLSDVIGRLVKLKYFRLSWVKKESKGPFSTQQLGMTLADATNAANLISILKELETLELTCNKIDDDGIKILMRSMEDHPSLKEVSMCHNKLGNVGARRASRIFGKNKNVVSMNLSNNMIGYEGARCISTVLSDPGCQLRHLNLSLNLISDKAAAYMIQDIMDNKKLLSLDLSSNLLSDEVVVHYSVRSFVQAIHLD